MSLPEILTKIYESEAVLEKGSVKTHITDNKYAININDIATLFIECFALQSPPGNFELEKFDARMVKIVGENKAPSIRINCINSGKTIGYIFTIDALSDPDSAFKPYEGVYAKAAIEKIIFEGIANRLIKCINMEGDYRTYLNELFLESSSQENYGVLVLSKDSDIRLYEALMWLGTQNIRICEGNPFNNNIYANEERVDSLKPQKLPSLLSGKEGLLFQLINMAMEQKDPYSKYLSAYQIIEILISQVFTERLSSIPEISEGNSAWKVKKYLTELTGEKKRIEYLYNEHFEKKPKPDCFEECKVLCNSFITNYSDPDFRGSSWAENIYKVRNLVVHGRAELLEGKDNEPDMLNITSKIEEISEVFLKCCIFLLFNFKK